jgi:hypothetical protein
VTPLLRVDDILAALILSLVMMRRIEIKNTLSEHNPNVPRERFDQWRALALRAHDWVAGASLAKVVGSVGWYFVAVQLGVGAPWFQLVGLFIFVAWLLSLVWAWKAATDAAHLRRQLGIQLRPRMKAERDRDTPKAGEQPGPTSPPSVSGR